MIGFVSFGEEMSMPVALCSRFKMEEAVDYIGCLFIRRTGLYDLRIATITRVGRNGLCWFREVMVKTLDEFPDHTPPCRVVGATNKFIVESEEVRGILVRSGTTHRTVQISSDKTWYLTSSTATYTVFSPPATAN